MSDLPAANEPDLAEPISSESGPVDDWRGALLARARMLIREADADIVEEAKWRKTTKPDGVPVWSRGGIICTGEIYRDKVKFTFMHGAKLADQSLFNASLDGNARRAIDLRQGDVIDRAFVEVVKAAVALNLNK